VLPYRVNERARVAVVWHQGVDDERRCLVGQAKQFQKQALHRDLHLVIEVQRIVKDRCDGHVLSRVNLSLTAADVDAVVVGASRAVGLAWTSINMFKSGPGGDTVLNSGKHRLALFREPVGTPSLATTELQRTEVRDYRAGGGRRFVPPRRCSRRYCQVSRSSCEFKQAPSRSMPSHRLRAWGRCGSISRCTVRLLSYPYLLSRVCVAWRRACVCAVLTLLLQAMSRLRSLRSP
jgi:hypothetical protein